MGENDFSITGKVSKLTRFAMLHVLVRFTTHFVSSYSLMYH